MGRRDHKKFDPLAELMAEFGPNARLGARQKTGAPDFDRRIKHPQFPGERGGHYDPYAQSMAPLAARTSLPTNRRNPKRKRAPTAWNQEFARLSRAAHAHQQATGCTLKSAWDAVRGQRAAANPNETRYFRQTDYHTTGDFTQDFDSPYEMIRGAYDARGPSTPPVNRRNPGMRKMGGAQLEALANRGDSDARQEMLRRAARRQKREAGRGTRRNHLWDGETFYKA